MLDRCPAERHDGEPFVDVISSHIPITGDAHGDRVREVFEERVLPEFRDNRCGRGEIVQIETE